MTEIILVGNPNTGKTTLFNSITGKNNHVGNWHGITVQESVHTFSFGEIKGKVVDLPGIYSLNPYSAEEKVATDYLSSHKNCKVICIADANTLKRNLLLALELKDAGYSVVLAVNMAKEVSVDYNFLQTQLAMPVVPIDARKKSSAKKLIYKTINYNHQNNCLQPIKTAKEYFEQIDNILLQAKYPQKIYGTSKLDKLFYNKFLAFPIFLLIVLCMFAITFGQIGQFLTKQVGTLFDYLAGLINDGLIKTNISPWAHSLFMGGIVSGVGVVISFLPQVILLNLCLNFLEDIGYLSRVAFMFDGGLKKIGLTGKSVMSILLGFGCTSSALLTTRALDNMQKRKQTALVIPFASCNAKLPIYLLVCSAFFTKHKVLIVFGLYLFSISLGIFISFIASKIKNQKQERFVMEMPPIRFQSPLKTTKNALFSAIDFAKRVGTTIVLCSVVVWVLSNITPSLQYANSIESSLLYSIAKFISPIFAPMGLNNWGIVVALLVGLSAKEMVVSSLAIINKSVSSIDSLAASLKNPASVAHLTPASAISFLIFILIYSPCMSAISVMSKELGKKFAIFVFFFQFAVAYVASMVAYAISNVFISGKWLELVIALIVLALFCLVVLNYKRQKNKCKLCKGSCNGKCCCY